MSISQKSTVPIREARRRYVVGVRSAPMLCGQGSLTYQCGNCGNELLTGVVEDSLKLIAFRCPACGCCSQIP